MSARVDRQSENVLPASYNSVSVSVPRMKQPVTYNQFTVLLVYRLLLQELSVVSTKSSLITVFRDWSSPDTQR